MSIFVFLLVSGVIIYFAIQFNDSLDTRNTTKKKDTNKTTDKYSYEQYLSTTKERLTLKSSLQQTPIQKDKILSRPSVWKATPAATTLTPLRQAFKSHNVHSLWHMTHIDNLESVLRRGILSHELAHAVANPTDISNRGVNNRRNREDPINHRKIHSYAPTYINVRNPMQFYNKHINNEICILEIALDVLDNNGPVIFCDGNAAAKKTKFFSDPKDVQQLPWTVLQSERWDNHDDGKRKRCSEVLIYPKIDTKYIINIHCCDYNTFNKISDLINLTGLQCRAEMNEKLYFR